MYKYTQNGKVADRRMNGRRSHDSPLPWFWDALLWAFPLHE